MPFRPYHGFRNRARLERLVADLKDRGSVPDDVCENFLRYHPAMIHKLRSAKYNLDRLTEKLTTTDIQEAADTTGDFMFEVNMFIDGFFYAAGSAMDILGRVVLTLFGQPITGRIYFDSVHATLNQARPADPILPRLIRPPWRQHFSDYRNTLTHELILAPRYQIDIDNTGGTPMYRIVFPLPDDPRATPSHRTYRRNPNVLGYVSTHFMRILKLANTVYGDIADRAAASGSLPI